MNQEEDTTLQDFQAVLDDQDHVVQMLELRDRMNAEVHTSEVRWSPITYAARRVLKFIEEQRKHLYFERGYSEELVWSVNGEEPHRFIGLVGYNEDRDNPMCAVVSCKSDGLQYESYMAHPIHRVQE